MGMYWRSHTSASTPMAWAPWCSTSWSRLTVTRGASLGRDEPIPVACTLTTREAASQLVEWHTLVPRAISRSPIPDGVELSFPAELEPGVRDLASREADCCAFLSIDTSFADDVLTLRITAGSDEGVAVIHLLTGLDPD